MGNTYGWSITWMCALLHWSLTNYPGSAYVQTSVGGYLFSIPGFNDQEKRTQAEAETWCTGNLSKLLQIENDSLQASVVTFINNAINQNLMTGNRVITNGKRYDLTWTWVNGIVWNSSLQVHGQSPGLPNSYGYLNSSQSVYGFFADTPTATRGYICEGASLCTDGFKVNGRCYKSYSEALSWFGARNRCLNGGGDLASFELISNAQDASVLNGSGWNQPSTYWVGLQRLKWTWQRTSSDVKYSQWSDGHPDYRNNEKNLCLCLQPYDWKWIECNCSQTYQFVCLPETQSASNSSSTSVNTINVITSKQVDTGTTTSQPVNSPPSITYPEYISMTTVSSKVITDYNLPVGLGVGLGGGALIVAIIVIVVVVVRRKGCHRQHEIQKPTAEPPDVTPESYYATVVKNPEFDDNAIAISQIPPPTEYADLNIVAISQSPDEKEQSRRSFV